MISEIRAIKSKVFENNIEIRAIKSKVFENNIMIKELCNKTATTTVTPIQSYSGENKCWTHEKFLYLTYL